ncbi:acyltransferase domain-containing protein [Candidatus Gracilibacteria bacterium]|nr:acyltransferase domain-containing protein [Candidatus Gracilibacteria bacterium]NJM88969.1 acyltransferase domain-containing protein [Hydrococcus sp. RU_2_2]NKB16955.1 acyltransferase domain-containing protein [Pseudanabaena sp. CRU_2_10]
MTHSEQEKSVSPIKRALKALEDMQAKLDAVEYARREPIAIVGMGCRFPGGANDPEAYWRMLRDGIDAIAEVPLERWDNREYYDRDPDALGKICTREGGFLDRVDGFDAEFFGISAREAKSMDPQQRLLLEVSWEAIENSAQSPQQLSNSATGVFVGIYINDYSKAIAKDGDPTQIDAFCAAGTSLSVAAGRLSYFFGLKGPSMVIDTSCSSSLITVHLACQSLRLRECDRALAGGVCLNLVPHTSIALSRTHMLNPDGRCKTFDADANGFVKGEGCGMVVLKRLSDAIADKDNILAVIRGSAVNHNGRSSSLIAPHGPSQQAVIRQALEMGGVEPNQIDYIEVQGTGTAAGGEPIEVSALEAVFGKGRSPDRPLTIGTVKTNIGHLEAASGIASLMKVVLAMQHGEIPPHLHVKRLNPYVNWDELPITVPTKSQPWLTKEKRRMAGVSAFGFSGTNAHVVLEEAPASMPRQTAVDRPLHVLALSAKTEAALVELAEKFEKHLMTNPDLALGDVCFSANAGRSHFQKRLSIIAASTVELGDKLAAFRTGQAVTGLYQKEATTPPKIAFLFPDTGCEYIRMGCHLYEQALTFRSAIARCDELLRPYLKESLLEVLYPSTQTSSLLKEAIYCQSALFALEYALFVLWKSWGIEPTAVAGYGVGEYVAACAAGVLSLEAALKLVVGRCLPTQSQEEITYSQPQLSLISQFTGELATAEIATPDYWYRYGQQPASLETCLDTLARQGYDVLVEISPKPTLFVENSASMQWLPSLHSEQTDWQLLLESLAQLYVRGAKVNWLGFDRDYSRQRLPLPTYPWQRKRYWYEPSTSKNGKIEPITQNNGHADIDRAIAQLEMTGELSPEELRLLPRLRELLKKQSQTQAQIEPSIEQSAPKLLTSVDIQAWLVDRIANELGVNPDKIDPRLPFDSYGLDSVLAIGIASAGKQFLGIDLTPILLVHYPTIESLSQYLTKEIAASESEIFEI